jgi:hypothetical protein
MGIDKRNEQLKFENWDEFEFESLYNQPINTRITTLKYQYLLVILLSKFLLHFHVLKD